MSSGLSVLSRRGFLCSLLASKLRAQSGADRPNIILIMADDLGYGDLGCYGQKQVLTPHLDRLASEGMRFTDAYSGSAVCAPSRCSLMTGMHQGHATVRGNRAPDVPLRAGDITIAELLKQAGYRTGAFGKWHLGGPLSTGSPLAQGFDEFYGFYDGKHAQSYYPYSIWDGVEEVYLDGNRGGTQLEYSQEMVAGRALDFVKRNRSQRFFMYFPLQIPHADSERGRRLGDGMQIPSYEPYSGREWPPQEKGFAAMVTRMDSDVGRLMALLKELGLDSNTLILFTSDNGPHPEGGHKPEYFRSSGPLRGKKRDLYEGGIRVPAIARWPAAIRAGSVSEHVLASWDFLPTCAELAGVSAPAGIDGRSFLPVLRGGSRRPHDYLYWEWANFGGQFAQAVRMGKWKGHRVNLGELELYDLKSDLGEKTNVAASHPDLVRKIEQIMKESHVDSPDFPIPLLPASGSSSSKT